MTTLFLGGTIVLRDQTLRDGSITCEDGVITKVSSNRSAQQHQQDAEVISLSDSDVLAPGFVDIHVHGGNNADFMDGTQEAVETACRAHATHGTTSIFPTTTTGTPEQIRDMLVACERARGVVPNRLQGVHLYGPFFAEDKVGCHSKAGRRSPTPAEYQTYFDSELIKIATCAAELPGADEFYREAAKRGIFLTCGHSNASFSEMQAAFDGGMRHVDHFWCAMSSVPSLRQRFNVPMQASMAEFVMMNKKMSTEVIADGKHLAPELLEFAFQMIGPDRLCLVTDCNRAMDMPPGEYRFGNRNDGSWLKSDGQVGWALDGQSLASSVVGMDRMVRHMYQATTASLHEVIRMATYTPATLVGIQNQIGSIEVGKQADFVLLDSLLNVKQVYVSGRCIAG